MTRSGTTSRNNASGSGATDTYSYSFPIVLETDLLVTTRVVATGVEATLVLTTDYTVTGVGVTAGGTIVLVAGNLATGTNITIRRVVPVTQLADIRNQGTYFPETQENQYDKHNDVDQQQQDDINRSLRIAETEDSAVINTEIVGPIVAAYVPTVNATKTGLTWSALVSGSNLVIPAGLAFMVQTAAGVLTARSFVAGTDITLSNTDGQAGDITINTTLAATLALTTSGNGSSLIGVFDTAGYFVGTTVEAVQAEINVDVVPAKNQIDFSVTSATTVVIAAGLTIRDSTEKYTITASGALTVIITNSVGALGLDQTAEGASKWYAIVAISKKADRTDTSAMLVEAANYPGSIVLPTGYDIYKRIGWVRNDGSSNFLQGQYYDDQFWFEDDVALLAAGTSATFAAISCVTAMPPTTRTLFIGNEGNTASATLAVHVRPTGSAAGTGIEINTDGNNAASWTNVVVRTDTSQSFDYKLTGGTPTLDVSAQGYIDTLEDDS